MSSMPPVPAKLEKKACCVNFLTGIAAPVQGDKKTRRAGGFSYYAFRIFFP
jgi:hypothetical protein